MGMDTFCNKRFVCGIVAAIALLNAVQHQHQFQGVNLMPSPRSSVCCRVTVARYWQEVDLLRKLEKNEVSKSAGRGEIPRQPP